MLAELKVESTLTDKYQTTMPGVVRKALGLKKRDRISYTILPDGDVLLRRATDAAEDTLFPYTTLFHYSDRKSVV